MSILFVLSIFFGGYVGSLNKHVGHSEEQWNVFIGAVVGGCGFMSLFFGLS